MHQYSPDHNAVFSSPDWNVSWTFDTSKDCTNPPGSCFSTYTYVPAELNGGLSIVGATLYFESYNHRLYALDATTGHELWSQRLPDIAMNTPIVADGVVVVDGGGASDNTMDMTGDSIMAGPKGNVISAFDADTGAPRWQFSTVGEDMPSGVAVGDRFIFTSGDNHVYALDIRTGKLIWKQRTLGSGIMSSGAVKDGIVYASTGYSLYSKPMLRAYREKNDFLAAHLGWTWALRPSDGQFLWTAPFGRGLASPVVADGMVFEETTQPASWSDARINRSIVVGLDAASGALRWRYATEPGLPKPWKATNDTEIGGTYVNGVLYETLPFTSEFAAFDGRTGRVLWKFSTRAPVKMPGVVTNGNLYFGDTGNTFYVVDAHSGRIKQSIQFPSFFTCSPPVIVGRTMFVVNGSAAYALRLADVDAGKI